MHRAIRYLDLALRFVLHVLSIGYTQNSVMDPQASRPELE